MMLFCKTVASVLLILFQLQLLRVLLFDYYIHPILNVLSFPCLLLLYLLSEYFELHIRASVDYRSEPSQQQDPYSDGHYQLRYFLLVVSLLVFFFFLKTFFVEFIQHISKYNITKHP